MPTQPTSSNQNQPTACQGAPFRPSLAPEGPHSLATPDLALAQVPHSSLSAEEGVSTISRGLTSNCPCPACAQHISASHSHSHLVRHFTDGETEALRASTTWPKSSGREGQHLTCIFPAAMTGFSLLPSCSTLGTTA